ncbi:MAG: YgeY family selenium metabolism-linked hydrolase [Erysipelotrichaceae bacterium]|nr:YgeY family selenium metabolism-linked hydrolase [Erysipelotrichaceae bacterium]
MEDLIAFAIKAVQTRSYSDEEENMAYLLVNEMNKLRYDEAYIDSTGNVVGRIGNGKTIIHFDGHMDTVEVNDGDLWDYPPFSGQIVDGYLWGRGSVDMKSALCAAIYGAAKARDLGYLNDKTVYVTGTVCEEYCDGVNLKLLYEELGVKPDYCIICEPSGNVITLGHKGKAQIRITTHGISAHGSAPEKGKNAVYEMAEIIQRVEKLNQTLYEDGSHGTIVLSDISCISASLNAVPSSCSIYLDRRLAMGETLHQVENEMNELIKEKDASWEVGVLIHQSWKGKELYYEPMHDPWMIEKDHPLTQALIRSYETVYASPVDQFDFWDFGTNAITPVSLGVPTIGFGPGEYKLAHMLNEHCSIDQIMKASDIYCQLIKEI